MNENDTNSILGKILNEVQIVNSYLKTTTETSAKTAVNTKSIRQDLRAVLDDGANHFHDRSCIHGKRKFTISGYTSTQVGS